VKIGLFTDQYYPGISGVVTSVKMLYEGLEAMGHECYIFTSYDEKLEENNIESNTKRVINFKGHPYPFKNLKDFRYTLSQKKCVEIVKNYNLDIIHIHTEYSIAKIAIKASKKYGIPIVHTLHTLFNDYLQYLSPFFSKYFHKQMLWALKKVFTGPVSKNSTIQIVPTKKVLDTASYYGVGLYAPVKVIPTGIELSRFYSSNFSKDEINQLKEKLNIKDKFVFLYVGRVSEEKNIKNIVNAYSKINKENTVLLIVGGGPYLEELKNLTSKLELDDYVVFTGLIPWLEVPKYYQLGDIFVNASITETQGLTNIEALASSIPLLIQKDDSVKDLIIDYYNGIYFDGVDELSIKMTEIIDNPKLLESIKNNTFESVKLYTKEEYAKNILNVYLEAINIYQNDKKQ
jgi:1,2-diacylglycerol 3-alpha-glucosyltransferase